MKTLLAKRLFNKKCLWLIRVYTELSGRFNPIQQNLDIVELSSIYAILPSKFNFDSNGKKEAWRKSVEDNLKRQFDLFKSGKMSNSQLRNVAYNT